MLRIVSGLTVLALAAVLSGVLTGQLWTSLLRRSPGTGF